MHPPKSEFSESPIAEPQVAYQTDAPPRACLIGSAYFALTSIIWGIFEYNQSYLANAETKDRR